MSSQKHRINRRDRLLPKAREFTPLQTPPAASTADPELERVAVRMKVLLRRAYMLQQAQSLWDLRWDEQKMQQEESKVWQLRRCPRCGGNH